MGTIAGNVPAAPRAESLFWRTDHGAGARTTEFAEKAASAAHPAVARVVGQVGATRSTLGLPLPAREAALAGAAMVARGAPGVAGPAVVAVAGEIDAVPCAEGGARRTGPDDAAPLCALEARSADRVAGTAMESVGPHVDAAPAAIDLSRGAGEHTTSVTAHMARWTFGSTGAAVETVERKVGAVQHLPPLGQHLETSGERATVRAAFSQETHEPRRTGVATTTTMGAVLLEVDAKRPASGLPRRAAEHATRLHAAFARTAARAAGTAVGVVGGDIPADAVTHPRGSRAQGRWLARTRWQRDTEQEHEEPDQPGEHPHANARSVCVDGRTVNHGSPGSCAMSTRPRAQPSRHRAMRARREEPPAPSRRRKTPTRTPR